MSAHGTHRFHNTKKWIAEQVRLHLIATVIGCLCFCWFTVSTLVYFAEKDAPHANITTFGKAIWWGVVTFLTVGYGDYFPITSLGKVFASTLMFSGVFGIAIITSKISSYFLEQILREGKSHVNTNKLKNHFIICGWKEDMHELLIHILDFNPDLEPKDLIIIANLGDAVIESILQHPRLKGLQFIVGDYYQTVNLERALPAKAKKVLILADRTPGATGVMPTATEIDARTIMTAMALSSIARGTLVTAEILDPKMDQYLKLASVSEIIYSREYSRLLLGNASSGTGISNVIFDLLDPKTPTLITTRPIQEEYFQMRYSEFKSAFETKFPKSVVIGILENTGNSQRIKEQALREAQKTPNMSRLVENLRLVKELRCNHPVFNPEPGYRVHEGSMVILIETREGATSHVRVEETLAA